MNSNVAAAVCDHRYGAVASWSHGTDTSQVNSFWWAEACAFRSNFALTVFDSPSFSGDAIVSMEERNAAAETGRLSFQVYLNTDSWFDPIRKVCDNIPDYYRDFWSEAGVKAGFNVEVGEQKLKRYPNHGQQMFDCSNGLYGYDEVNGTAGKMDVFSGVIQYQCDWIESNFAKSASAGGYRNGQTGSAYKIPDYLLMGRNSCADGNVSYGLPCKRLDGESDKSSRLSIDDTVSLSLTTRAGDMDGSCDDVRSHCQMLVQKAIEQGGWYRDFNHWHTSPRFEMTIEDFLTFQREAIGDKNVVSLDFGEAVQHNFLRDMATVSVEECGSEIRLDVTFRNIGNSLPLQCFHIPLSVRLDFRNSAFAGNNMIAGTCPITQLEESCFVVNVPFHGQEETVSVVLSETVGSDHYQDHTLPKITNCKKDGDSLLITTDKVTRAVLFSSPKGRGLRFVESPDRSNSPGMEHYFKLQYHDDRDFYVGVITPVGQSVLVALD